MYSAAYSLAALAAVVCCAAVGAFCPFLHMEDLPAECTSCFSINCFLHALFFLKGISSCLSLPWNLRTPLICCVTGVSGHADGRPLQS